MTISRKILASAAAAATAAVLGLTAACGGTSGTAAPHSRAPASVSSQTAHSPRADLLAWMDAGGYDSLQTVVTDLNSGDTESPAYGARLAAHARAARAHPLPASVDPAGAYTKMLDHIATSGDAIAAGDPIGATSGILDAAEDLATVESEIEAVTPAG